MAAIDEIARDVFRISIHVPAFDLQFNHFLVRDEEPLLFHAGMRQMFPALWEAVGQLIDPTRCTGSVGVTSKWTNAAS
jgi:hypothetical protein